MLNVYVYTKDFKNYLNYTKPGFHGDNINHNAGLHWKRSTFLGELSRGSAADWT